MGKNVNGSKFAQIWYCSILVNHKILKWKKHFDPECVWYHLAYYVDSKFVPLKGSHWPSEVTVSSQIVKKVEEKFHRKRWSVVLWESLTNPHGMACLRNGAICFAYL